ncbi:glycosyltransferase [Aeromicrobium yanjiei]|uniref:glycosyltransferase n=1 Tax=Aeromicrobium yanjiei TaxID=2662028 RepID=UPI001892C3EE|nr:glycosyltransferase [Aeromicrobium yanjiei]
MVRRVERSASSELQPLVDSRLVDPWYYSLQTGRSMDAHEAARHYLDVGAAEGLLPNPLTDVEATGLAPDAVAAAVRDGSARLFPVRPLLDDVALVADAVGAADHPGGPVGFYLEHAHAGAPVPQLGTRSWRRFVAHRQQQGDALRRIVKSGLFDRDYYELQAGRTFLSGTAAVWHFLEIGESAGLTPQPLYDRLWYRGSANAHMPLKFASFLRTGQVRGAAGPHFDGTTYLERRPEAADHVGGPLGHFLEHADESTPTVPAPASGIEPTELGALVATMRRVAADLGEQERIARRPSTTYARWWLDAAVPEAGDPTVPVAIVSDAREWTKWMPKNVDTVLRQEHPRWTLRVAVDAGQPVPLSLAELHEGGRVVLVETTSTSWAERVHDVLSTADEPWACFWQPQEAWSPHHLSGLLSGVADGVGAHAATVDSGTGEAKDAGPLWRAELPARDTLLWDLPRGLAGMLFPTEQLRAGDGAFRAEAEDQYGWDHLLRSDLPSTFVPFVAVRGSDLGALPLAPGLRSTHEHVIRAEHILDWPLIEQQVAERVPGRVSMLIPAFRDRLLVRAAVEHVLAHSPADIEVVVVDNGSDRDLTSVFAGTFAGDPRVRIRRLPRNTNFGTASNVAFAESTGEVVVFLNNDTEVQAGWLPPLVEALEGPDVLGAQPLLLYGDGTVQSAGTVFNGPDSIPGHLLAAHPVEDVKPEIDLRFPAVTAACMAVRADVLAPSRGFDPVFANGMEDVDLCLRLAEERGGSFVTVPASQVVHLESKSPGRFARVESNRLRLLDRWHGRLPTPDTSQWEQAGFEVLRLAVDAGLPQTGRRTAVKPVLRRRATVVESGPAAGLPRLRWAIKNPATWGPLGDVWGDTFFAGDLAHALRHWGQEVVVDRRPAFQRPGSDDHDDVTLLLRGRVPCAPLQGATNVVWVISHPDEVPVEELAHGYDLVYAAGVPWAEHMSATAGVEVRPLLQATNPDRFRPSVGAADVGGALFVGNTRGHMRQIVGDAIEAGLDLRLYGRGWEAFIDESHVAATYLDNVNLAPAYRAAHVVLNDHWEDMARNGFLSNRLFDAAASGARIVSDRVPGLEEIFGPSVQTYDSLEDLSDLASADLHRWPSQDELDANAVAIASRHSFVERARVLLADVLDVRGVAHSLHELAR